MLYFQKKRKIKNIVYSPFVLIILVAFLFLLIKGVWNLYAKVELSRERLRIDVLELSKLSNREENLSNLIDFLKTDFGIENEIRTKFKALKEGEEVAVIVDETNVNKTMETRDIITPHSFWYKLFHWPQ